MVVAVLMVAAPFVTLIFDVVDRYSGPESWWPLGMSALFAVFLVAAVRCLAATDAMPAAELGGTQQPISAASYPACS